MVDVATDGQAALACVRERAPDLVLSDIMMPKLDGCELLQALRGAPQTRNIPIVLLSARSGEIKTRTSGGGALTTTVAVAVFVGSAFAVATT